MNNYSDKPVYVALALFAGFVVAALATGRGLLMDALSAIVCCAVFGSVLFMLGGSLLFIVAIALELCGFPQLAKWLHF